MAEVILKNLSKDYPGPVRAVDNISLHIKAGEFVVLVGPSGCGKSTTLRMVAGLEDITEGEITIGGRVVNNVHPKDRDIAMVFQNYALYPHMTVYKNMSFALKLRKVPKAEIDRRVRHAASILDITEYLDRKPKALSGGQRQRVALGRCIVREPAAFLFDEPLSNLDAKLRVTTRGELKALHQRLKTTTLYVTHDQEEAMTLGDRIVVMSNGKIQQADAPFEVYRHPINRFVAGFIGTPPMNFLEGTVERDGDAAWWVETVADQPKHGLDPLRIRVHESHAGRVGQRVGLPTVLGIRPQTLIETATGEHAASAGSALRAMVEVVDPLGDQMDVRFQTAGHRHIVARVRAHTHMPVGQETVFTLDTEHLHYFEPGEFGANLTAPLAEAALAETT